MTSPLSWSENTWVLAAIVFGTLTALWLIVRHRERLTDLVNDWLGREAPLPPAYAVETAQHWAAEVRGLPEPGYARLPDEDTRTMLLSQLAEPCPDCGGDHPGECLAKRDRERYEYYARPENRVIAGPAYYRKAQYPTPEAHYSAIAAKTEEILRDAEGWHWVFGKWEAPASLVRDLPAGDWLRDLVSA